MALNWDITKVVDHESLLEKREDGTYLDPITEAMVWCTMSVDMGSITERNVDEFIRRIVLFQEAFGPILADPTTGRPRPIVAADVRRRIGLTTNVRTVGRATFHNKLKRMWLEDLVRRIRRREAEAAAGAAVP